jgi:hypothetical protein
VLHFKSKTLPLSRFSARCVEALESRWLFAGNTVTELSLSKNIATSGEAIVASEGYQR